MKPLFILLFICVSLGYSAEAQRKHGYNRIYPTYATQHYYDRKGIKYDGKLPENHIHPRNTDGHSFGLQYERVTRYGLILGAGVQYGVRRYEVIIQQDFSDFDPDAVNNLNGVISYEQYPVSVNYCGLRFNVGYRRVVFKNWAATVKLGIAEKRFYDGPWSYTETDLSYDTDDGNVSKIVGITYSEMKFGRQLASPAHGNIFQGHLFPNKLTYCDFYIGIERDFNMAWVKNISIGLEGNRSLWIWDRPPSMYIWTSPSIKELAASKEYFIDRNMSLGVRVSVGIWR